MRGHEGASNIEKRARNAGVADAALANPCAHVDPALPCGALLLLAAIFVTGCASSPETQSSVPTPIEKTYEADNAALQIRASRSELAVADRLDLVLEASTTEDRRIEFPSPEENLGEFRVIETRRGSPKLRQDGRLSEAHTYVLEPFPTGRLHRSRDGGSVSPQQPPTPRPTARSPPKPSRFPFASRPFSPPPRRMPTRPRSRKPATSKKPPGPVDLPALPPWVYWVAGGAIVALLIAGIYFWRRRQADAETATPAAARARDGVPGFGRAVGRPTRRGGRIQAFLFAPLEHPAALHRRPIRPARARKHDRGISPRSTKGQPLGRRSSQLAATIPRALRSGQVRRARPLIRRHRANPFNLPRLHRRNEAATRARPCRPIVSRFEKRCSPASRGATRWPPVIARLSKTSLSC